MWVGGCVTAPVAWTSGPSALASRGPWGRRHRGTRGPRPVARATVGTQECTQTGENRLSTQPPPACRMRPLMRPIRRVRLSVRVTPRVRLYVSRRLQSGALVYAVATRFAEASTHTNPRRAVHFPSFPVFPRHALMSALVPRQRIAAATILRDLIGTCKAPPANS